MCLVFRPDTRARQRRKPPGDSSRRRIRITSASRIPNCDSIASNGVRSSHAISMIRSMSARLNGTASSPPPATGDLKSTAQPTPAGGHDWLHADSGTQGQYFKQVGHCRDDIRIPVRRWTPCTTIRQSSTSKSVANDSLVRDFHGGDRSALECGTYPDHGVRFHATDTARTDNPVIACSFCLQPHIGARDTGEQHNG